MRTITRVAAALKALLLALDDADEPLPDPVGQAHRFAWEYLESWHRGEPATDLGLVTAACRLAAAIEGASLSRGSLWARLDTQTAEWIRENPSR